MRWWFANDWSSPTVLVRGARTVEVQQDEQADVLEVAGRLPWARLAGAGPVVSRLATTLAWRLTGHWGGWTDRPIEAWHRLGRYSDFDRRDHPRDAVRVTLREPGGATAVALRGPRLAVGDAVARTALTLLEGGAPERPWALAARLDLKAPLGRLAAAGGSGGPDAGVALAASGPLAGWLTGHAQLTLSRLSRLAAGVPLQPRAWVPGAELSLAAALPAGLVLLAETRVQGALFERGWALQPGVEPRQADAVTAVTRTQNQLTFAVRRGAVTVWLSEDFTLGRRPAVAWRWFYDQNAPDLVLGVAVALP